MTNRIRCTPKRLFSWQYRLRDGKHEALLEFRWKDETGTITADGRQLNVAEDAGQWTLRDGDVTVVTGRRTGTRPPTFTVQKSPIGTLRIRAVGRTERAFTIERGGKLIGRIAPVHLLTRRARIECSMEDADFVTLSFLFWIVVVSWRRAVADV